MRADMSANIGEQIIEDMRQWSAEKEKQLEKAMSKIQRDMKLNLEFQRSSREKEQSVYPNRKHKTEPGTMRKNWANASLSRLGRQNVKIKAVRNKAMPTVVHLVNFGHAVKAHGRIVGEYKGNGFVSDVQEWGNKELEKKIREIYGG